MALKPCQVPEQGGDRRIDIFPEPVLTPSGIRQHYVRHSTNPGRSVVQDDCHARAEQGSQARRRAGDSPLANHHTHDRRRFGNGCSAHDRLSG